MLIKAGESVVKIVIEFNHFEEYKTETPVLFMLSIYNCETGKSKESINIFCFCRRSIALVDKYSSGCEREKDCYSYQ